MPCLRGLGNHLQGLCIHAKADRAYDETMPQDKTENRKLNQENEE
ncbi:hypothetical protein [Brasilonema bromeliae]